MKLIDEMRDRQAWQQPKPSSPLPIVIGAVIAFGVGVLGVSGLVKAPNWLRSNTETVAVTPETRADVAIDSSAHRLGRAETAPLLKMCMPMHKLGFGRDQPIEAADLYRLLQAGSAVSRVASIAGVKQNAVDDAGFATLWADVADCIYRQNGWMMCDPDNRALAVEAANTLVRQVSTAVKSARMPDTSEFAKTMATIQGKHAPNRDYLMQSANAAKTRVLSGLRNYVADGRLTASDFGFFAPAEITQVVRETKVARDACASRG